MEITIYTIVKKLKAIVGIDSGMMEDEDENQDEQNKTKEQKADARLTFAEDNEEKEEVSLSEIKVYLANKSINSVLELQLKRINLDKSNLRDGENEIRNSQGPDHQEDEGTTSKWINCLEKIALKISGGKISISKLGTGSKVAFFPLIH